MNPENKKIAKRAEKLQQKVLENFERLTDDDWSKIPPGELVKILEIVMKIERRAYGLKF